MTDETYSRLGEIARTAALEVKDQMMKEISDQNEKLRLEIKGDMKRVYDKVDNIGESFRSDLTKCKDDHAALGESFNSNLESCQRSQEIRRRWGIRTWMAVITIVVSMAVGSCSILIAYKALQGKIELAGKNGD